jgi:hypothetical protein
MPMAMRPRLGKNVTPASMPGPMGLGFGSCVIPRDAIAMMTRRGPVPAMSMTMPIQSKRDHRAGCSDGIISCLGPEYTPAAETRRGVWQGLESRNIMDGDSP